MIRDTLLALEVEGGARSRERRWSVGAGGGVGRPLSWRLQGGCNPAKTLTFSETPETHFGLLTFRTVR